MKKLLIFFSIILFSSLWLFVPKTSSDELSDIGKQIQDLTTSLNMSIKATRPLESQLDSMKTQIQDIKNRLSDVAIGITVKEKNINEGYKNLAKQTDLLDHAVRDFYIKTYYNSPLSIFLTVSSVSDITQILAYQKQAVNQDKAIITNIALSIEDLEAQKKALENEKATLTTLKSSLDEQSAKLDKIVEGAKAYQQNLTSQIAVLSARQEQILAQRLASLNIPLYASALGGCSSDLTNGKNPGFSPAFGFFTYGVPNRVGLNQYGAWGRAKAGQDYQQILQAYYNFDSISAANTSIQINVSGYGNYSLEDYVKRIYEVPDSWTDNNLAALKAQAIAVRSYVLSYTNNGQNPICPTQQCQVFQPNPKGGNWEQAVDATAGLVMMQGGQPIKAWFSSTHGGYIHSSGDIGWGNTSWTKNGVDSSSSISNFSDLQNNAYDKDSPWFYCDWGSRSQYDGTAWLTSQEVADIANVILLVEKDSGTREHLYQTDQPNPAGTDTWDEARVKQELSARGGTPFNSVSSFSISADFASGKTSTVTVSGDAGTTTFDGSDFKTYFNLRAPANIQIVGPLFNAETK